MPDSQLYKHLESTDKRLRMQALADLAERHQKESEFLKAVEYGSECLEILKTSPDPRAELRILNTLARSYFCLGNHQKSLEHLLKVKNATEILGDKMALAKCYNRIGIACSRLNRYDEAMKFYTDSLEIHQTITNITGVAALLNNIGELCFSTGETDKALSFFNRSVQSLEMTDALPEKQAILFNNIGNVHLKNGNLEKALLFYEQSLALKEEAGDKHLLSNTLINIGELYRELKDHNKSLEFYYRSLEIASEIGNRHAVADSMLYISLSSAIMGEKETAFEYAMKSLAIAEELEIPELLKICCQTISSLAETNGDLSMALEYHKLYKSYSDLISSSAVDGKYRELLISWEAEKLQQEIEIQRKRGIQLKKVNDSLTEIVSETDSPSGKRAEIE